MARGTSLRAKGLKGFTKGLGYWRPYLWAERPVWVAGWPCVRGIRGKAGG